LHTLVRVEHRGDRGVTMAGFRAYLIDDDGHIKSSREFDAADDVRAINHARQWVDGRE
jgi:hypothetical protein